MRGFILALMRSFLFADKKRVHVHLCFLPLLRDSTHTRLIVGVVQYLHTHIVSYAEPAWIVDTVLAVILHRYMYVKFFD